MSETVNRLISSFEEKLESSTIGVPRGSVNVDVSIIRMEALKLEEIRILLDHNYKTLKFPGLGQAPVVRCWQISWIDMVARCITFVLISVETAAYISEMQREETG